MSRSLALFSNIYKIGCLALLLTLCAPARADTVQALKAIEKGQWTVAQQMIAQERDPLAHKLYTWIFFRQSQTPADYKRHYKQLAQFIRQNPDWPAVGRLKTTLEKYMPDDLPARDITAWFDDYPPKLARSMDMYLGALTVQGRQAEARATLRDWWGKTTLSRDDQRMIFQKYSAYIDTTTHIKRLNTLLSAAQYTNARAVAAVLGQGYPALTEARIALAEEKPGVNGLITQVPASLQGDPGLLYERLRWRRRMNMDDGAIEILLDGLAGRSVDNPKNWWRERHIIARRLMEKKQFKQAYLLVRQHKQKEGFSFAQAEWLAGFLALRFMDQPTQALQHFETLYQNVSTPVSRARGAYWAGRALEQMGQKDLARRWYTKAAQFQTVFYGQLAGEKIGQSYAALYTTPPVLTPADKAAFQQDDLVRASVLLHQAGMDDEAGDFIQAFVRRHSTPKAYEYAAGLASNLNLYYQAVQTAKKASREGLFLTAEAYPLLTNHLQNINIEWALVHGIIRQESVFNRKAQSPAGALGLMQLMPGTAQETARKIGIPYNRSLLTARESYNIRLGSAYLDGLVDRFAGAYPLAIAGYNAGPGRVDNWLKTFGDPRTGEIDLIDWLELIPIYETRNYVQRVMEAVYVYRLRLRNIQTTPKAAIHVEMR